MVGKELSRVMQLIHLKPRRSGLRHTRVRAHLTQMMDHLSAE
jgi:hypothetical protein